MFSLIFNMQLYILNLSLLNTCIQFYVYYLYQLISKLMFKFSVIIQFYVLCLFSLTFNIYLYFLDIQFYIFFLC